MGFGIRPGLAQVGLGLGGCRLGFGVQSCGPFRPACGCVGGFMGWFGVGLRLVEGVLRLL